MRRADHVAGLVDRLAATTELPVSVKCRLGVHASPASIQEDTFEALHAFVSTVTASGCCRRVVVHARSAVLQGLSPAANREVPPLRYDLVMQLANEMSHLDIVLNGGVSSIPDVRVHEGSGLAGVMSGRWCLRSPFDLLTLEPDAERTPQTIIDAYCSYAAQELMLVQREERAAVVAPLAILFTHLEDKLKRIEEGDSPAEDWVQTYDFFVERSISLLSSFRYEREAAALAEDKTSCRRYRRLLTAILGKKYMSKLRGNTAEASAIAGPDSVEYEV